MKIIDTSDRHYGSEYLVRGQFLVTDQWWKIKATIKPSADQQTNIWNLCHSPKYYLRDDVSETTYNLFLTQCEVEENRKDFEQLVKERDSDTVSLKTVIQVASDLYYAPEDEEHASSKVIATRVVNSGNGSA